MTTYIATATEAAALRDGSKTVIVVPVKPQPVFDNGVGKWLKNANIQEVGEQDVVIDYMIKHAPYSVGQKIGIREAWRPENMKNHDNYEIGVRYRSDNRWKHVPDDKFYWIWANSKVADQWRSPATMPRSAIRQWPICEAVECVRVRDMTEQHVNGVLRRDSNGFKIFIPAWGDEHTTDHTEALKQHIIAKYGQSAWDNNIYVWLVTVKNQEK